MDRLRQLQRLAWVGGCTLLIVYGGIVGAVTLSVLGPRIMLPDWIDVPLLCGLALVLAALLLAALTSRGRARLWPLLHVPPVAVLGLAMSALVALLLSHREIDRVTLPDGRVVMLTIEPAISDTFYGLWKPYAWGWRRVAEPVTEISYSEDGSFTENPALVLTPDARHLLIRRGGIWTDCLRTTAALEICSYAHSVPTGRAEFLARSDEITERTGHAVPKAQADIRG